MSIFNLSSQNISIFPISTARNQGAEANSRAITETRIADFVRFASDRDSYVAHCGTTTDDNELIFIINGYVVRIKNWKTTFDDAADTDGSSKLEWRTSPVYATIYVVKETGQLWACNDLSLQHTTSYVFEGVQFTTAVPNNDEIRDGAGNTIEVLQHTLLLFNGATNDTPTVPRSSLRCIDGGII